MSFTDPRQIDAIVSGRLAEPFATLGPHRPGAGDRQGATASGGIVVRAFMSWAASIQLVPIRAPGERGSAAAARARAPLPRRRLERVHPDGLFEVHYPEADGPFAYRLRATATDGRRVTLEDPYRFTPVLAVDELEQLAAGAHRRLHRILGARLETHEGVKGVCFAVWAPGAHNVNLMGTFNGWDGRCHPMRARGASGIWELFLPGFGEGVVYKYEIQTERRGIRTVKADPYGFAMELRPNTASIVRDLGRYRWRDGRWMRARARRQSPGAPITIYEVHLGSWRRRPAGEASAAGAAEQGGETRWLTYRELADELVPYVKELGHTHIELLPVTEYPHDQSWGYQAVGYFAPTSRYGTPDDFRHLVDTAHRAGLGVILDWVPAHFPRDAHGLGYFDGTHLYEHADPRRGAHPDWGTFIYDYGRPEVSAFLISSALFWLEEYHIDGLRVDAVASMLYLDYSRKPGEWVPNRFGGRENLEAVAFVRELNRAIHDDHPDVLTFAEESTAWPGVSRAVEQGGLGFDVKWNMGWMHDMLAYMRTDPLFRPGMHDRLSFTIHYAFSEHFLLPLSHDEVVHGKSSLLAKMPGEPPVKFANQRLLFGYMYAHPGKKLLFMGSEIGLWSEWDQDGELEWELLRYAPHRGLRRYVQELNRIYAAERALHQLDFAWQGFEWIDFRDRARGVVAFLRWSRSRRDFVVVVASFTPVPRPAYRLGVPRPGTYRLLLSSDRVEFGGSGRPDWETVQAEAEACNGQPYSVVVSLPPLAILYLQRIKGGPGRRTRSSRARRGSSGRAGGAPPRRPRSPGGGG